MSAELINDKSRIFVTHNTEHKTKSTLERPSTEGYPLQAQVPQADN